MGSSQPCLIPKGQSMFLAEVASSATDGLQACLGLGKTGQIWLRNSEQWRYDGDIWLRYDGDILWYVLPSNACLLELDMVVDVIASICLPARYTRQEGEKHMVELPWRIMGKKYMGELQWDMIIYLRYHGDTKGVLRGNQPFHEDSTRFTFS